MRIATIVLTLMALASPAFGADKTTVNVAVNGLVCDFCARSIEKVLMDRGDVESVKVDLDKAAVVVVLKAGSTLDDSTLTKLITDAGYTVVKIERLAT